MHLGFASLPVACDGEAKREEQGNDGKSGGKRGGEASVVDAGAKDEGVGCEDAASGQAYETALIAHNVKLP
jgi:hypothetical protein